MKESVAARVPAEKRRTLQLASAQKSLLKELATGVQAGHGGGGGRGSQSPETKAGGTLDRGSEFQTSAAEQEPGRGRGAVE